MRRLSFGLAVLIAFSASAQCAPASEQIKIGIGYGLAFLPFYICEDLKLVEKYARADHLDIKACYTSFLGSGPVQDAIGSGAIDMGPFGPAPFLAAWEQQKDSPQQAVIVSGITTMPLTLLSDRPNVASLSDLGPTDRIAMPSLTALNTMRTRVPTPTLLTSSGGANWPSGVQRLPITRNASSGVGSPF